MLRSLTDAAKRRQAAPMRERISLRSFITWTNVASILVASLVAGYYALTILSQNKLNDTWAILFLELEHQGSLLADKLTSSAEAMDPGAGPDGILQFSEGGGLQVEKGGFDADLTLADFNLSGAVFPERMSRHTVLSYAGDHYLARIVQEHGKSRMLLNKLNATLFEVYPAPPASQGVLYLITREGRLLYSSDSAISELNVAGRPLVQHFISAPIKQGQMEIASADGEDFYGYFLEVKDSNVVMFSEVKKAAAMAPVRQVVGRFLAVLAVILLVAVVTLQLPLSRITGPVRELAQLAMKVGQGRFDVSPRSSGFGELSQLTTAFSTMAKGLVERDHKLAALMSEHAEKTRLESELAIARRIQENLLPDRALPSESGLLIAAEYISAAECAGDWYHYVYDPVTGETIVIITDVSGHGAGSSMFTAIIAGLFDEFRSRRERPFDMVEFAKCTNDVIRRLGRQQWHATMIVARYIKDSGFLDVMVAGHPLPLIRAGVKGERGGIVPPLVGSSILGSDFDFKPTCRRIPFAKGTSLLLYTDGLIEAANAAGKMFGRAQVRDVFLNSSGDPREALAMLLDGWRTHLAEESPGDDVCVIAMRAA